MNLSDDLSVDKELFSGVYEGKYVISLNIFFQSYSDIFQLSSISGIKYL